MCNPVHVSRLTDGAPVARQTWGMTRRPVLSCVFAFGVAACAAPPALPRHADAVTVLQASSEHYASLQHIADSLSVVSADSATAPSETSRAAAAGLSAGIASVRGDFEAVTLAMTTRELEQTRSLWMRLALGQAALESLDAEARRIAADPLANPAELRDLAVQLSGALELARMSSRRAAARWQAPPLRPPSRTVAL